MANDEHDFDFSLSLRLDSIVDWNMGFDANHDHGSTARSQIRAVATQYDTSTAQSHWFATEGEGSTSVMGGGEATWISLFDAEPAKLHDGMPQTKFLNERRTTMPPVKKRSFKRAARRAHKDGGAWYQGRYFTVDYFPCFPIPTTSPTASPHLSSKPGRRRIFASWNCSGLSREKFQNITMWLERNHVDAAVITETRWSMTNEWSDRRWHVIHSGKGDGVMILLSRRRWPVDRIAWRSLVDGRLLHVRLHGNSRATDLIGCYQYPYQTTAAQSQNRKLVWDALSETLMQLPRRNALMLAGDFNCDLRPMYPHIGSARPTPQHQPQVQYSDQETFQQIVRNCALTGLNTWSGIQHTHEHQHLQARLDFMFTTTLAADAHAKSACNLWDAPMVHHNGGHCVQLCSSPIDRYHATKLPYGRCALQQRVRSSQSWQQRDEAWNHLQSACQSMISQWTFTNEDGFTNMHSQMTAVFHTCYPPHISALQPRVS